ncbi:MAG: pseudouridine synthase [Alphaproteobacteria bacterium]|nr:pseudouridine synthase [Alphaproteobacteria bacterium]
MEKQERIAKIIAAAGICSRRDAERLIGEGRVSVNGKKLDTPAFLARFKDDIRVDGKPIAKPEQPRLFLYHKPAGLVTTHRDEKDRDTIFQKLPKGMPRVVSVGRLDLNSEGLLLLTTSGTISRYLELPKTGWKRRYRVRVHGAVDDARLKKLEKGLTIEGVRYAPMTINLDMKRDGGNSWLTITLQEGKNREIRRIMEFVGLKVSRLIRISYGVFELGDLPKGAVKEIPFKQLKNSLPAEVLV